MESELPSSDSYGDGFYADRLTAQIDRLRTERDTLREIVRGAEVRWETYNHGWWLDIDGIPMRALTPDQAERFQKVIDRAEDE